MVDGCPAPGAGRRFTVSARSESAVGRPRQPLPRATFGPARAQDKPQASCTDGHMECGLARGNLSVDKHVVEV